MLRSLCSPAIRSFSQTRRSFVSAVLLSRPWDNLTVLDLKKEARIRGLSPSGNKTTLISRIQEHEKALSSLAATSTSNVYTAPETPSVDTTQEGETPGIPLASQSAAPAPYFLNVALPDAAYDEPEHKVSIPYTFDFLASPSPAIESLPEQDMPKMVVIGGEETYGGASPTHHLFDDTMASESEEFTSSTVPRGKGGILDDLAEDMGLPHFKDMKNSIFKFL
ncbi:hypothetical protein J3R30DRAFT_864571 [Lentinula aciculospora]|uniref:SAP domain-containing protein n=1 Tax=Lentinula aciculospora TaxID=153920 RepID=A0A9W9AS70_9AGAR|nr:hypothetical protein J3R30DRAFT_864571 [Lentinula aciculospora]